MAASEGVADGSVDKSACAGGTAPPAAARTQEENRKESHEVNSQDRHVERGVHLLDPMKAIVKKLLDEGKTTKEICKQLGMKPEEVFRLSDFSREDFLRIMTEGSEGYSKARLLKKV